jgi:hypothetical protein
LLEDAARLAAAANAKLAEALAIAEQARRDAAFNEDRRWFKLNPGRNYLARLATAQEVEDLHSSGAWSPGWTLDPTCFVWAIVRGSPTGLEALCFVLPVPRCPPREDELRAVWGRAAVERTGQ